MDFNFPSLSPKAGPIEAFVQQLSPAQAHAQASVLKPLISDVICRQLLPAVTHNIFSFSFQAKPVSVGVENAFGEINADAQLPVFTTLSSRHFVHVFVSSFITKDHPNFTPDHQLLTVYVRVLQSLFTGEDLYLTHVAYSQFPASSSLARPSRASFSLTFRLKKAASIPDLLADLVSDGLDLTSLKPFLAVS